MEPYKTMRFGVGEIPAGLTREHHLKADIRGELLVTAGSLVFVDALGNKERVTENQTVHIEGGEAHHLEAVEGAAIVLRLFRRPTE